MTYLFSNTSSIFQSNGTAISDTNPLAVTLGGANITIAGNTNVISNVTVTNFPSVQAVTGNVNATVIGSITVSGITSNINVNPITGSVNANIIVGGSIISNSNPIPISGNVGITGNVNVNPISATITSLPNVNATIINSVTVSSISSNVNVNPITGSVNANIIIGGSIVSNANPIPVTGNVGVVGNVNVNPITGSVNASIIVGGEIVSNANPIPVSGNVGVVGNVGVIGNINITGGNITTTPALSVGDFYGEPYAIPITPVVQTDGRYGTNSYDHQIYTASSGNVSHSGGAFSITCSGTTGSYGLLRTRRFNTFKPAQSFMARWLAKFDTPTAGTSQRIGVQNQENAYYLGLNGTTFGVLHTYNGRAPIYRATVTSYTGTQVVTLTLNSVTYTTTIQTGETTNEAAQRISEIDFGGAWLANQRDNTVELLYTGVAPLGGTFSITGAGTFSGSVTQVQAGVTATNTWYYNGTDFNMPAWFHPGRYNSYEVKYSWSGINFFVLNPNTGQYDLFYQLVWAGSSSATQLPVNNPAFKIAGLALNTGSLTGVTMNIASMMSGLEGITNRNSYTGASAVTKSSLTQNVLHHLVSIQNPYTYSDTINTIETLMSDFVATTQCNDPAEIYMYLDAPLLTGVHNYISQDGYPVTISTATGTIDPATNWPVVSFVVGNTGSSVQFALETYRLVVPPGSTITIAIRSTAVIQKAAASIVWYND